MPNPDQFKLLEEAPDVRSWLAFLSSRDQLSPDQQTRIEKEAVRINASRIEETPIYLRALSGIGAVISGFLFLFFLFLFGLFDFEPINLTVNGLILMGLATLLHWVGREQKGLGQDFLIQMALTLLQAGKITLVIGLAQQVHEAYDVGWFWPIAGILGFVAILSFVLFPSSLERFVAAGAFFVAVWASLLIDSPDKWIEVSFNALVIAHLLVLAAFLHWRALRVRLTSLYDAVLVSLCIGVGVVATLVHLPQDSELAENIPDLAEGLSGFGQQWPTQLALSLSLIALILWIAGRHRAKLGEQLIAACLGVALLGLLSDPGIMLALGVMVLGYATHRPIHTLLGLLFAIGFGFHFYYALNLTLLAKSMLLIASGLLFLGAAAYIYHRKWSQDEVNEEQSNA